MSIKSHIISFSQIDRFDLDLIGKKAYEISELVQLGIPIPDGFVILPFPDLSKDLIIEIRNSYKNLSGLFRESSLNIFISSSSNKSTMFANVKGDANLTQKIKEIAKLGKSAAIVVQKNIQSKTKGKIFTNDDLINNPILKSFAKKIQKHFYFPKELDYAIEKGKIYITQIKPFTGIATRSLMKKVLAKGVSINPGIVTGQVKIFRKNQNFFKIKNTEILAISELSRSLYGKIKNAKAIITDSDLPRTINKFNYRQLIHVPTIISTKNATRLLKNGNIVTVNGMTGEIFSGGLL